MFKSIRWRFIAIYFLLILIAMTIVGFIIIGQLQNIQLDMNNKNLRVRVSSIYESSTAMQQNDWIAYETDIRSNVDNIIQLGYGENVYIIANDEEKTIIASSIKDMEDKSAYAVERISSGILTGAMEGVTADAVVIPTDNSQISHICYPVKNEDDEVKGFIYLTNDISQLYVTLNESRNIFTQATAISLVLTVLLGLLLSQSITGPIKALTAKVEDMSKGDFDNKVVVKSDDEIGQLGKTFNYLIDELNLNMSKLTQEKSKLETTFSNMRDGILTVDKKGNIIQINPVAKKILSVRKKDTIYDQIMSRKTHDLYLDIIEKTGFLGSYILEDKNATYQVDYAPFKDGQGQIGGVILVFKNITEKYKTDRLQQEFVANVSHELKTPITTVKSYSETLLEGALEDRETAIEFLTVVKNESDRMSRLVSDLLKLSRMDYEQTEWNKEKLSINEVVKDVYSKLNIQAKAKNIKMSCTYDERNSYVMFDRDGLEQVLINIIGNAVKYTPNNGSISISISSVTSNVVISVADTGVGIPKEELPRVFERFYRVDKARSREMGGTGLGLSIAQQIAKAHDSVIEVESDLHI